MFRHTWRVLLFVGLLFAAFAPGESTAQSAKKRGGPTVDLDGFKSQVFDYWKAPDKEKLEKPLLNKFTITDKDKSTAEIIVKELGSNVTANDAFDEMKKQMKPPEGKKIDEIATMNEVKKEGPKISQLVLRTGSFTPEGPKAKELKDVRVVGTVVETKDKRYFIRLVGPRVLIGTIQPDLDKFLQDFKK